MQEPNTPFLLKNIYNAEFLNTVVAEIALAFPVFPQKEFITDVFDQNWTQLELKQRIRHISFCLRKHLPESYATALSILQEHLYELEYSILFFLHLIFF